MTYVKNSSCGWSVGKSGSWFDVSVVAASKGILCVSTASDSPLDHPQKNTKPIINLVVSTEGYYMSTMVSHPNIVEKWDPKHH